MDIVTLSIDIVLSKKHFYWEIMQKSARKASPRPLLILVSNQRQPLHARNSFLHKIRYIEWGFSKSLKKS